MGILRSGLPLAKRDKRAILGKNTPLQAPYPRKRSIFPMKQLFAIYSKIVMPLIGKLISKDNSAYTYLPESIRAFPQGEVMQQAIQNAGFSHVYFKRLTFGICTLYVATK